MLKISEAEYERIKAASKANKNKRVAKRLEVLELRYARKSKIEIAEKTGFNKLYVTTLIQTYKRQGLEEYIRIKQTSHRRNMSEEEEAKVLAQCEEEAEAGKVLTAETVRRKLEEQLGRETSTNYVYRVMERNGWRKVMPRSRHPKAASQEEQDSSKKLNLSTPK
jgi:transposase